MREVVFVQKNQSKWTQFEKDLSGNNADKLADTFVELTDDLAYARTFYPSSNTESYLNQLAGKYYLSLYKNKKQPGNRFITFWKKELPLMFWSVRKQLLYSFAVFAVAMLIGAFSSAHDEDFVRLILGDDYVNTTLESIAKNDPMAVYKQSDGSSMFVYITANNIKVSFMAFIAGIFLSVGTIAVLFFNGVMLGAFQYFFFRHDVLVQSLLTIWIHGTLEISAIVIAGCAGLVMGNSILFPGTYSRAESFSRGVRKGLKIVIGLIPVFITAGFLESFVTRHTEMPVWLSLTIIGGSASFIVFYFILYPFRLNRIKNGQRNQS